MLAKVSRTISLGLAGALMATAALAAPTAKQTELAHRYIAAVHMDRTMDATMKAMMPSMLAAVPQGGAAQEARRKAVTEVLPDVMHDMMSKMMSRMEPIVAETFTELELADLVKFYESPTGQAVVDKTPQLAIRMAPMMRELMPEMTKDLMAKVCARADCSADPKAAPKPS
jgi:hypothetical protein